MAFFPRTSESLKSVPSVFRALKSGAGRPTFAEPIASRGIPAAYASRASEAKSVSFLNCPATRSAVQRTARSPSFFAASTTSDFSFSKPSDSTARIRTATSGSALASSASPSADALSPRIPSARAAIDRTNTSSSLSAALRDLRSAPLMISNSRATRSSQPLSKFSNFAGNFSARYFSRGERASWAQPPRAKRARRRPGRRSVRSIYPPNGRIPDRYTSLLLREEGLKGVDHPVAEGDAALLERLADFLEEARVERPGLRSRPLTFRGRDDAFL